MKKILVLILTLALMCPCTVLADETNAVTAAAGLVKVSFTSSAPKGTPALLVILPSGGKTEQEMAESLSTATNTTALTGLNLEYAAVLNVGEDGLIKLSDIKMKDGLQTGKCFVFVKFLNSEGYVYVGDFDHVGVNDVRALAAKFDAGDKDKCGNIIDGDINGELEEDGESRKIPKEILRKSSADVSYYSGLSDDNKAAFHRIFYTLKGDTLFVTEQIQDTPMVKMFNDAVVWTKLCTEADTLSVLGEYNGTTEGKFWDIEIGDTSDFATLTENEKTAILKNIKDAKYTDKETLAADFEEDVVLALFRSLPQDREALEALIAENGKYASYFANVRKIVADANLSTYDVTQLYNNVLAGCAGCTKFDTLGTEGSVEALFKASIPTQSGDGGSDSESDDVVDMGQGSSGISNGGSGGGGGGGGIKKDPVKENEETKPSQPSGGAKTPFADVSEKHWANEYVAKLYESGAINGVSESAFNPSGSVQRQDFVKILIGALGTKLSEKKSEFADVQSGAYYESYVMTALENGFISGTGDGAFGIGSNLKREDAAVIMARVLDSYGVTTIQMGKTFNDNAQVADYAQEAIKKVSAIGIFGGDDLGNFNPKGSLTRAEACAILCRLADAVKEV